MIWTLRRNIPPSLHQRLQRVRANIEHAVLVMCNNDTKRRATISRQVTLKRKLIKATNTQEPKSHPRPPRAKQQRDQKGEIYSWGDKWMRTKILWTGPQQACKSKGTSRAGDKQIKNKCQGRMATNTQTGRQISKNGEPKWFTPKTKPTYQKPGQNHHHCSQSRRKFAQPMQKCEMWKTSDTNGDL